MGELPTIYIISDSIGETARAVAQAAMAQFDEPNPSIEVLSKVKSFQQVKDFLEQKTAERLNATGDPRLLVFYTLVHGRMRDEVSSYIDGKDNIRGIDLLTSAIDAISDFSGIIPNCSPGALRVADINYFHRVEAIEYAINHDDGRNPQDLGKADIVLIGVSRSSKTPISIYLAQHGYHVANVPIDNQTTPPRELFDVDPTRVFGLVSSPEVLASIRSRRLGNASEVASSYADLESIYDDLDNARTLMRRIGCYVVRTDNRAIEESSQEILAQYFKHHEPASSAIIEEPSDLF